MKEFKGTEWTRGKLLKTRITSQWDQESFEKTNRYERTRVFSNFSEKDQGKGRVLVCTLNESHPDYELNSSIITAAPELLEALIETDKDLCILEVNMAQIEKIDPRADGMTRLVSEWRNRNKKAINKALGL